VRNSTKTMMTVVDVAECVCAVGREKQNAPPGCLRVPTQAQPDSVHMMMMAVRANFHCHAACPHLQRCSPDHIPVDSPRGQAAGVCCRLPDTRRNGDEAAGRSVAADDYIPAVSAAGNGTTGEQCEEARHLV
jgi:hypothetical protein